MAKKPKPDGLEYLGVEKGKRKFLARLVKRDPRSGKKVLDTRRVILADTKGDALKARDKLIEEELSKRLGRLRVGERLRFASVADEWFATVASEGTRISWGSHLRKLKAHFGDWWLDAMTTQEMQRYLANVKGDKAQQLDDGTVNSRRDVLIKIFEYAADQGLSEGNPASGTRRRTSRKTRRDKRHESIKRPKKSLTPAEAVRLFADLRQHDPDLFPLIRVQYAIGSRFAEVSALRLADVDMNTGLVRVRHGQVRGALGPTKAGYERLVGIGKDALSILRRHRAHVVEKCWPGYDDLLFPRPPSTKRRHSNQHSISTVHHAIKRAFKRLGLEVKGTTHVARRTANNIARRTSETGARMAFGHQSPEETLTYAEQTPTEAIELGEAIDHGLSGGSSGGTVGPKNDE